MWDLTTPRAAGRNRDVLIHHDTLFLASVGSRKTWQLSLSSIPFLDIFIVYISLVCSAFHTIMESPLSGCVKRTHTPNFVMLAVLEAFELTHAWNYQKPFALSSAGPLKFPVWCLISNFSIQSQMMKKNWWKKCSATPQTASLMKIKSCHR